MTQVCICNFEHELGRRHRGWINVGQTGCTEFNHFTLKRKSTVCMTQLSSKSKVSELGQVTVTGYPFIGGST